VEAARTRAIATPRRRRSPPTAATQTEPHAPVEAEAAAPGPTRPGSRSRSPTCRRHQQVEPDRAPTVLLHQPQLGRQATRLARSHHQPDRGHHHPHRHRGIRTTRRAQLPRPDQALKHRTRRRAFTRERPRPRSRSGAPALDEPQASRSELGARLLFAQGDSESTVGGHARISSRISASPRLPHHARSISVARVARRLHSAHPSTAGCEPGSPLEP
jgi:hypothetical protein